MNLCWFFVVEKWTPIILILDHILQVPPMKPSIGRDPLLTVVDIEQDRQQLSEPPVWFPPYSVMVLVRSNMHYVTVLFESLVYNKSVLSTISHFIVSINIKKYTKSMFLAVCLNFVINWAFKFVVNYYFKLVGKCGVPGYESKHWPRPLAHSRHRARQAAAFRTTSMVSTVFDHGSCQVQCALSDRSF